MPSSFGPYDPDEIRRITADQDQNVREDFYESALKRYRKFVSFVDEATRNNPGAAGNETLDRERRTLHEQIFQIALDIGKAGNEVFVDLLELQRNLQEYGLPEFRVISGAEGSPEYADIGDDVNEGERYLGEIAGIADVPLVSQTKKDQVCIAFVDRYETAVRDRDSIDMTSTRGFLVPMERRGDQERLRRAARFAKYINMPLTNIGFFSHEYVHSTYALVVEVQDLDRVASALRDQREEFGIRAEDLDPKMVEQDWRDYQQEVSDLFDHGLDPEFRKRFYEHRYQQLFDSTYAKTDGESLREILDELSARRTPESGR